MGCKKCNQPKVICQETKPDCGCPVTDLSTDCIQYTGDTATCSGILNGVTLTEYLEQLETYICEALEELTGTTLVNVGSGAGVYKGIDILGRKEIRTLTSTDESVSIVVNGNEIDFSVNIPPQEEIEITSEDNSVTITQTENTFDLSVEPTVVEAGSNVTVTGAGTEASPYVVASTDTIITLQNGATTTVVGNGTTTPYSVEVVNSQKTLTLTDETTYTLQTEDNLKTIFLTITGTTSTVYFQVPAGLQNNFTCSVVLSNSTAVTNQLQILSSTQTVVTPNGYNPIILGKGNWLLIERNEATAEYYVMGNLEEL
jgi:hypothetical protein